MPLYDSQRTLSWTQVKIFAGVLSEAASAATAGSTASFARVCSFGVAVAAATSDGVDAVDGVPPPMSFRGALL